jgi:hypothetical protein
MITAMIISAIISFCVMAANISMWEDDKEASVVVKLLRFIAMAGIASIPWILIYAEYYS